LLPWDVAVARRCVGTLARPLFAVQVREVRGGNPYALIDPALVLSVAANETRCNSGVLGPDGEAGVMAIMVRTWTPTAEELRSPAVSLEWGMWFLQCTLGDEEHNPYRDVRRALAAYNCGWDGVDTGRCGSGGYHYADRVLYHWLPLLTAELQRLSDRTNDPRMAEWLDGWGYGPREFYSRTQDVE